MDLTLAIYVLLMMSLSCMPTIQKLRQIVQDLNKAYRSVRLKLNSDKIKLIRPDKNVKINIGSNVIERIQQYSYLGYTIQQGKKQMAEITKRIGLTLAAFKKLKHMLKDKNMPINPKRKCTIRVFPCYYVQYNNLRKKKKRRKKIIEYRITD